MDTGDWLLFAFVAKFLVLIGVLGMAGSGLSLVLFRTNTHRALSALFGISALVGALGVFAQTVGFLSGSIAGMTDTFLIGLVLKTPLGTTTVLWCTGIAVVAIGLLTGGRARALCVSLGSLCLVSGFLVSGHINSTGVPVLMAALGFHVGTASVWFAMVVILHNATRKDPVAGSDLALRFGRVALWCVPLMFGAGFVMAYAVLGDWQALWSSRYGIVLLCKIGAVGVVIGLAGLNKLRFVPALKSGGAEAQRRFLISLEMEGAAMVLVLGFTAALTSFGGP